MSGINRLIASELTSKKYKGKKLKEEIGKEFSPENILRVNKSINPSDPDGDGDTDEKGDEY